MPARSSASSSSEDRGLLGVVGTGRVARSRPDALVGLGDERVVVERLVSGVAPQLGAHALVEPLGEGLGEPVGQRGQQDGRVVVVVGLEARLGLGQAVTGGDREGSHVVGHAGLDRGHVVRQRDVRTAVASGDLLAQRMQARELRLPRLVRPDHDVVIGRGRGRPEAHDRVGAQQPLGTGPARAWPRRRRRAPGPQRPRSRPRGWPDSGPSAPRSRRTATSRCAR